MCLSDRKDWSCPGVFGTRLTARTPRAGKLKKAFGLYNQSRDIDAARTGVFLPLSVYIENARTAQQSVKGVALYGSLPGSFEYQLQYGTLDSEFEKYLRDTPDTESAEVADDGYILHLVWNTPVEGLKFAGTFNHESWSSIWEAEPSNLEFGFEREAWIVGMEYTHGNVTCAAEYTQFTFDMEMVGFPGIDWTSEGYYGLLSYRFTDWVEVGTSYAVTYQDIDDKEGNNYELQGLPRALGWSKDLALSTRFDLNDSWIVKLEGHWFNGLNATTTDGGLTPASEYGDDPSEDGFLGAVKVTFSF